VVVDPAARSIAVYDLGVEAPRSFTGDVVATIVTAFPSISPRFSRHNRGAG
jgi:hypothetical protein